MNLDRLPVGRDVPHDIKDLEAGKWVKLEGRAGPQEAREEIFDNVRRYEQAPEKPHF